MFERYIGIDYSGARTPTDSLKGLRVYESRRGFTAAEVLPPPSPRKYWTRRGLAEWLASTFEKGPIPTFVGIDHAFSFPYKYFTAYDMILDWPTFLADFRAHWPTDDDNMYVDFIRDGRHGNGAARSGNPRWRRLTELRARTAKSVFHFDVQGTVAKSTHSGLPWLLYLRERLGARVFFWPFDGWRPPLDTSVIAEVYPAIWSRMFPQADRTPDQQDAFAITEWVRREDERGSLETCFQPLLSAHEESIARIEGWIFGVS